MKWKFTYSELQALDKAMELICTRNPKNYQTALIQACLMPEWKKINSKLKFDIRKKYSISLTPAAELAFYLFFYNSGIKLFLYEATMVNTMLLSIHKNYDSTISSI